MRTSLRAHLPEYLMEAAGLGIFMVSAGLFGTLLEHPASPLRQAMPDPLLRRLVMGLAMGLTAVGIVYSPWGKRSGAHLNPAFTLTFLRLDKIAPWDAVFYVIFQFLGGLAGLWATSLVLGRALAVPTVDYVVTVPGPGGTLGAFAAEALISFGLMVAVLYCANHTKWNRYTGLVVGALLVVYITFEAPYSGMSLNPARTFASAWLAGVWRGVWVYFTAPLFGMLLAVEVYAATRGAEHVLCAKLHHENDHPCIFHCAYPRAATQRRTS